MKQKQGFSAVAVIIGVVAVALLGIATYFIIDGNNKATDFNDYNFYSVIAPDKNNGNIGDHVKGDANAPVLIFEYADYQCPGCASINPKVNKAIEELDGKLAVVYRSFLLSYHKNGTAAASAAEAAGLQGYWKPYADKLLPNNPSGNMLLPRNAPHFLTNTSWKSLTTKATSTNSMKTSPASKFLKKSASIWASVNVSMSRALRPSLSTVSLSIGVKLVV